MSVSRRCACFLLYCDLRHVHFSDNPLATGFPLDAGHVKIRVPDVKPRNNYIVARESTSFSFASALKIFTGFCSPRRLWKYQPEIYD